MDLTCIDEELTLQGDGSMGIDFEYQWQGPGINASNENDIQPLINVPGTYILIVTNLTNDCPSIPDTVIIGENNTRIRHSTRS